MLQKQSVKFTIILVLICHIADAKFIKIYPSRCLGSEPFILLRRNSLEDCQAACVRKAQCVAMGYERLFQLCHLHDELTPLIPCGGHVVILRTDIMVENADLCTGSCPIDDCHHIPSITDAKTSGNLLHVGNVVKVECSNDGSVSYIQCQQNGQWTRPLSCSGADISCGNPVSVANSVINYSSTLAGSVASYTCSSGYSKSPSSSTMSITCLANGQWETVGFTCQQVDCGTPQDVANSQNSYSSTTAGAIVTYTCNAGYSTFPSSAAMSCTCLNSGQWETIGFTCQQIDCGTPQDVDNSQNSYSSTTAGSIVTYTCNSGYSTFPTTAAMSFTCLNSGQWETVSFICQQVDCGTPQDVANSQNSYSSTIAGSIVTYTCNAGYSTFPTTAAMSFTCLNSGQWETIGFTCQQIGCGTPQDVANSQNSYSSTTAGSIVTYTCNSGYSTFPSSAAMTCTCLNSGQWETIGFACQQIDCDTPQDVANSQNSYSSTTAGSVVTYTCNSGYSTLPISAPMSLTCQDSGQWETAGFTCVVDCGIPPTIENGQSTYTSTNEGSVVRYNCDSGHVVLPANAGTSITCQPSGSWESVSFSCTASVPVGTSCSQDGDCVDPAARCLFTGFSSIGSRCYCDPLYEFNHTMAVCTKVCDSYTSFESYTDRYIRKHNVGDSNGAVLTEAECLQFCADNYGDSYLSVDHRHGYSWGTNCYCGSVTRQQILDASPSFYRTDNEYKMFTMTCY